MTGAAMYEYNEPHRKIWVLVTKGRYAEHCGWINKDKFIRRYDEGMPEFLVHVQVTKTSAISGESCTFDVPRMISREAFSVEQMELPFMDACRRVSSSRKVRKSRQTCASAPPL
jgi:hypothetical protein